MERGPNQNSQDRREEELKSKTYYEILGILPTATDVEIKQAFYKLAQDNHPDKGGDTLMYQYISQAYTVLKSAEKRKDYDSKNAFRWAKKSSERSDQSSQTYYRQNSSSNYGSNDEAVRKAREEEIFRRETEEWKRRMDEILRRAQASDEIARKGRAANSGTQNAGYSYSGQGSTREPEQNWRDSLKYRYEKIEDRNGIVVGSAHGYENLLDPRTGNELSKPYQHIESR
ncbi:DnaJ domain-containing protein, partial [Candidatus Nomurabacteria bacterium]|nr:DnaJ domain-containing protein [Candidatus Nomurabacteria bacterium]